jgi:hypothetical protein
MTALHPNGAVRTAFWPCWRLHPRADSRAGLDRAGGLGCGWRRSRPIEF